MGKTKRKKSVPPNKQANSIQYIWIVISVAALLLSGGLFGKLAMTGDRSESNITETAVGPSQSPGGYDSRVQLVASRFRCACGGCGELPLDECTCDMPKGAVEEKNFIRKKLQQGLTVDQVIKRVNEKYGHMNS